MKVLLSGSSGFIGKELSNFLKTRGCQVFRLVRNSQDLREDAILWDPEEGIADSRALEGFDAIIHLAGENIASGRWTEEKKQLILTSRVQGTQALTKILCDLKVPPSVFICASAIGFYGDQGSKVCTEGSPSGLGFLPEVCRRWETATLPAKALGIRTINLRTGLVLSPKGGSLAKMTPLFKLGLGGKLSEGKQYVSWIALDDLLEIILFILTNEKLEGPVNAVSPNPVTNAEFTEALGKVFNRPTFFSVPRFALRLFLGKEMADELLLSSSRVEPLKLIQKGYPFIYPNIEGALKKMFKKE